MKDTGTQTRFTRQRRRLNWHRVGFVLLALIGTLLSITFLVVAGHFVIKHW